MQVMEIARRLVATASIAMGLYLFVFGNAWAPLVLDWLPDSELGGWLELIVPFLPMAFILFGAAILSSRRQVTDS